MADALRQQMADDIASLVRKQTFAGSGVWRQSGNATLRIETQTDSIVEALQRIPSVETQEEEEREDDRQHEELVTAIENVNIVSESESSEKKSGGLFSGMNSLFKGLGKIGTLGLGFGALGLKGILKGFRFLLKGLKFLGGPLLLLSGIGFLTMKDEDKEALVQKVVNFFTNIGKTLNKLKDAFVEGFEKGEELDTKGLNEGWANFTNSVGSLLDGIKFNMMGVDYGGSEGVAKAMGVLTKTLSQRILDFTGAVLNFLADPEKGINKIIDDFLFNLSELFSKAGLVRMAESYGMGSLISKEFRQEAANEQIIRALKAGRDIKPSDTVERVFDAEDYGSMSAPNLAKSFNESFLGKGIDNFFINAFKSANEGLRMLILPDNLLNEIKGSRQTGGKISETGLYKLHAGEIVFDPPSSDRIDNFVASYLPQSGATINGLQMDRMIGGTTGSAAPVVIDNSQQPTIINQTNVAAPQTRGPALVGEGRDKVNMR